MKEPVDLRALKKHYEEAVREATSRGIPIAGCNPSFLAAHAVAALPVLLESLTLCQETLREILEISHKASQDSSDPAYIFIERRANKALQGEKL